MSQAVLIQYGGTAPAKPAENTAFHEELIETAQAEAKRLGWAGSAFESYRRSSGYVSLAIIPGGRHLTLDDLRDFRAAQKSAGPPTSPIDQPQQERLAV